MVEAPTQVANMSPSTFLPGATVFLKMETAEQNPLKIIQTSLQKLSSYLDTLAAVEQSSRVPQPLPHPNPVIPRTNQGPATPPATLADLISLPLRSRKR